jgi:hypothetical protein
MNRFGTHDWQKSKRYSGSLRCTRCYWIFAGPLELAPDGGCTALKRSPIKPKPKVQRDGIYGEFHEWISSQTCHLEYSGDCLNPVKGHHIHSVGAGGVDKENEIPLCVRHHAMIHAKGVKTFARRWALDLEAVAREYYDQYVRSLP